MLFCALVRPNRSGLRLLRYTLRLRFGALVMVELAALYTAQVGCRLQRQEEEVRFETQREERQRKCEARGLRAPEEFWPRQHAL